MKMDKTKPAPDKSKTAVAAPPADLPTPPPPAVTPPLFRRVDWLTFFLTTLFVLAGYIYTLAPDSGLEDSGELAVASFYGGIPHPPGYPVWTIYTYFWANWVPVGNIAWRVGLGIAVSGAIACGLLGLMISRGSSMMMEGIPQLKEIGKKWENAICIVAGFVGGLLLGYNGYMWSQSIIVEVYSFSVLSLIATMIFLLRWVYAPHQNWYLYLAFFMYGICVNNHQSLLPIAMGLEALILAVKPRLGREFLFWNVVCYLGGLAAGPSLLAGNTPVYVIFNSVGLISTAAWTWVSIREKREVSGWIGGGAVALAVLLFLTAKQPTATAPMLALLVFVGVRLVAAYDSLFITVARRSREWWVTIASGLSFLVGLAFYLYMPIAGASNPPMQWGYPRTLEGFIHAITRGQYEKIRPTSGSGETFLEQCMSFITTYAKQVLMYFDGLDNEFNLVCILLAVGVFLFYRFMQRRERNWVLGVVAIFFCLGPVLILLLNPPPDRQARDLIRVFFTASHVLVSMGVGYGIALVSAYLATHYQSFRKTALVLGIVAVDLALYTLAVDTYSLFTDPEVAGANLFMNGLVKVTFILLAATSLVVATFQLMRSAETDGRHWKPTAALAGIGFVCLLICITLFRHAQLTAAQEALTGLDKFGALITAPAEIGTDAPAMLAIAKVLMVLITVTSLFFVTHQKQAGDQLITRLIAGLIMLGSAGLTLVVLMGEQFSLAGIGQFFSLLAKIVEPGQFALPVWASIFMLGLMGIFVAGLLIWKNRAPLALTLAVFAAVPLQSYMANWADNEQRGHLFGYWFGHDMFSPPFKDEAGQPLYPEMARNAVLYGGTDPGRFCPTYTIFCESFIPPECKPLDPEFDRRDVYIITQNALADGTYLNYIRAHYHRSAQKRRGLDTPFFQEVGRLLQKPEDRRTSTNWLGRALLPLDRAITRLGESIEKNRRAGSSFFQEDHFVDVQALATKLAQPANEFSRDLAAKLKPDTRALLSGGDEDDLKDALAKDFNELLETGLFDDQALAANVDQEWATLFEYERIQDEKQQLLQVQAGPLAMQRVLSREAGVKQRLTTLKAERQQMAEEVAARLTAAGAPITPYLKAFIYEAPQSFTRIRLQRLLLEAAFPDEIIRSKGGVYPDREIHIASPQESQECFAEYMADAQRRLQAGQLRPGEDVRFVGGKVQVSGQVAVMAINGLLTKVMFDKNPDNEFYVEESFPLEWMYPHLTPFGIIMKINREPLPTFTEDIFQRDHEFWRQYSDRLIGNWITYDTPVSNIVAFVEKVYLRRNWGDLNAEQRKFARDSSGQKAFSKLRSSIGGIYAWRLEPHCPPEYRPKTEAEVRRFYQEADFAFRQAFAFCPYSPEALFRYVKLLAQPPAPINPRIDDALLIARTAQKLDPYNTQIAFLISSLEDWKRRTGDLASLQQLENEIRVNPNNLNAAVTLAYTLLNAQQFDRAYALLDTVVTHPNVDMNTLAPVVDLYKQLNNFPKLETALMRLTELRADSAEAWFDLGTVRMAVNRPADGLTAFSNAFRISDARRATNPTALDLKATARTDPSLAPFRANPEFQKLLAP